MKEIKRITKQCLFCGKLFTTQFNLSLYSKEKWNTIIEMEKKNLLHKVREHESKCDSRFSYPFEVNRLIQLENRLIRLERRNNETKKILCKMWC